MLLANLNSNPLPLRLGASWEMNVGQLKFRTYSFVVAVGIIYSGALHAGEPFLLGASASGLKFPIFTLGHQSAVAVAHIGSIRTEYQRKGFFRVGLLRELVIEDIQLNIIQPHECSEAFAGLGQLFGSAKSGAALNMRDFSLLLEGRQGPVLRANELSFTGTGDWRLSGVLLSLPQTNIFLKSAVFSLSDLHSETPHLDYGTNCIPISLTTSPKTPK